MKIARFLGGSVALVALAAAIVLYSQTPARSFDIKDSQAVINRPSADITDIYMFPSPTNSNNVVIVMDVYPLIAPGQGLKTFFDQQVLYTMKFDSKYQSEAIASRPVEDIVIQFSAGPPASGTQQIYVYGPASPNQTGATTKLVNGGNANGIGFINRTFSSGGGLTVFAGARQDPFFFDLNQFYNILPDRNQGSTASGCLPPPNGNGSCPQGFNPPATATNYFMNYNTLSIVVEMPRGLLTPGGTGPIVAYWATTSTESGT